MKKLATWAVCAGLLGGLGWPDANAQSAPPVPIETFFQPAALSGGALSPNGRYVAFAARKAGERRKLVMVDLQSQEPPQIVAYFDKMDVVEPRWVDDDNLVFSLSDDQHVRSLRRYGGLFAVSRDGKKRRPLIKIELDTFYGELGGALEGNHDYLARGKPGSGEVVVGAYLFDNFGQVERVTPIALNVQTRARRVLVSSPPHPKLTGWWFDTQGRPRLASASEKGELVWFYADTQGAWQEIGRFSALDPSFTPVFVDAQDRIFVTARLGSDLSRLHRFDLATKKVLPEPVLDAEGFDLWASPILLPDGRLGGYSFTTESTERHWMLPAMQKLQAAVDARLPGRINSLYCAQCDDAGSVLVFSYSDRFSGEYLHIDGKTGAWQSLGKVEPALDEKRMGATVLERAPARDGLSIPTWFTVPAGKAAKNLPAVVIVHGGPWSRGRYWEFDADAQFLASRGYLVIEPEFRGSISFGEKHFRAGWKQWGQAMQDDVLDSLQYAIKKGYADPKRVCIAGASYGGYAALMGLVRHADAYRCAISWVGVTDLDFMYSVHWSDFGDAVKTYSLPALLGDREKDREMLATHSPLKRAKDIKKPVLLAYGNLDRRVPPVHGQAMRKALEEAGNPPEYVEYDNEAHGWHRTDTRVDFWGRVERFLQQHLKP